MYRNITEKFRWGNINDPSVYLDETNIRMASNLRSNFGRLARNLVDEGKEEQAIVILDLAMDILPNETVPFNYFIIPIIENYFITGEAFKGSAVARQMAGLLKKEMNYYISLNTTLREYVEYEMQRALSIYKELLRVVTAYDTELEKEIGTDINSYYQFIMEM